MRIVAVRTGIVAFQTGMLPLAPGICPAEMAVIRIRIGATPQYRRLP